MQVLFSICCAVSLGLIAGVVGGLIKQRLQPPKTPAQTQRGAALVRAVARVLKYITLVVLALGIIWCVYLLVLGLVQPDRLEMATNLSQLIVSVLTVISILFAFFEFLKR